MDLTNTQAKEILKIIGEAGKKGISRGNISKKLKNKGCDCENWINTFHEAGIIEICGYEGKTPLYRLKDT